MDAKFFKTHEVFRKWLEKNFDSHDELWIGFYKSKSEIKAMTYKEALDEALCFGWVDGLKGTIDEVSYRIRFTQRKPKSIWSKINIKHVERLVKAGKMMPAGQLKIDEAKRDGRWDNAYEPSSRALAPDDFLRALDLNKAAKAFYSTLSKQNLYAIYFRLQNAKRPETRQRWLEKIIVMLERGETFH